MTTPRVSVGVPAFNRAATVGRAIASVLDQTYRDLELIVSDNASTDATESICRQWAARDARLRYTRQATPLSAFDNFRFVLEAARAPYFMWLPADDYALPGLLARAVALLDARPGVVCAVPRTDFVEPDGRRRPATGTAALAGGLRENVCRFLVDPTDNSRFYGLYRREAVRRALPASAYYAFDWALTAGTLRDGTHAELDQILLVREATEPLKYTRMLDQIPGRLARLLPLARFTRALLCELRLPPAPCVLYGLLRLNVIHHVMYCQYRYPRYGRLAYRIGAALERAGAGARRALGGPPA